MKPVHALLMAAALPAAAAPRNFLFILVDDLGCRDLGVEGSSFYETPNIDALARSGMRFEQGYAACAVCSPSRASILTGKATTRHGITDWIGAKSGMDWNRNDRLLPAEYVHNLPKDDITIAEALRSAGYTTFFAGKWHLGSEGSWPEDHGFQINKGGWEPGSPKGGYFAPWVNPKLENGPDGECLTLRLANETARFLEENKDHPFFAYLSFYAVHGPIQTTRPLWQKYRNKAEQHPVQSRFIIDRTLPVRQVQDNPVYGGLVETMDRAVGIVLSRLTELGLDTNTVVIFTSDNGGVSSGDSHSTCNLPFRGGKGRQWEGGIREPFYIRAPGVTVPGSATDIPAVHMDFYPTILELAGLPLMPKQHMDGTSLVPALKGESLKERDLFWHYPHYSNQGGEPSSIIRSGDWKLIHYYEDGRDELYNLIQDQGEQHDLAAREPERTAAMRARLDAWLVETGARIPQPDPRFNKAKKQLQIEQTRQKKLPALEKEHAACLAPDWQPNPTWWKSLQAE
jgi:arylsulfatase A-like enzyme